MLHWSDVFALLAALGLSQAALGYAAARRFARARPSGDACAEQVTVLKPLHGGEPLLTEALRSFLTQTHPGVQVVFGVQSGADAALDTVDALLAEFPGRDIAVVADPRAHGRNRKVCNLINMLAHAKHDVLLIADSDVHAAPDLVTRMLGTLARPGVGLVTAVYAGLPASGTVAGRLAAMQIGAVFLPGALLARALGRQDCLGATMMLRRATLDAIGGFAALSPHLADDAVLGRLVRARGLSVALAPAVPLTTVPERSVRDVVTHELRWFRTVRALEPAGFAASVLQYPVFFAGAYALAAPSAGHAAAFAAVWLARATIGRATHAALARLQPRPTPAPATWLWPLRDTLSVLVMAMSYAGRSVRWRGHVLHADAGRPATLPPGVFTSKTPPGVFTPQTLEAAEGLVRS